MTIAVSVLVPGGIVLAADSRQIGRSASGQLRVDSDNAEKVFELGPYLAATVYGQGFFYANADDSPQNIGVIINRVSKRLPSKCTVRTAAEILHSEAAREVERHCDVTGSGDAGIAFHVAGYSPGDAIGELYHCRIPGEAVLERKTSDAGLVWSGQREIIDRLIWGYDARLIDFLSESASELSQDILRQQRGKLQLHINFQTMPLQDAVDLAVLLSRVTIELQRLSDGIVGAPGLLAGCGGPIDVAVITATEGFRWLQRKELRVRLG